MTVTPNLALPYIDANQSQKHVTHNDAIRALDALCQLSVLAIQTAPPGSPANGDCYLVAASATGAWTGKDKDVAAWQDGAWYFYPPEAGWTAYNRADCRAYSYNAAYLAWEPFAIATPNGAATLDALETELVTLSGGTTSSSAAKIRNRDIVLGVSVRVVTAITGATSYSVGVSGTPSQFGSSLGIALGSNNVGVIGPTAFYADTPILFTSAGGAFAGGQVRLAIHALRFLAAAT